MPTKKKKKKKKQTKNEKEKEKRKKGPLLTQTSSASREITRHITASSSVPIM